MREMAHLDIDVWYAEGNYHLSVRGNNGELKFDHALEMNGHDIHRLLRVIGYAIEVEHGCCPGKDEGEWENWDGNLYISEEKKT